LDAAAKEGKPTFEYGIQRGINAGYLSKYKIYSRRKCSDLEAQNGKGKKSSPAHGVGR